MELLMSGTIIPTNEPLETMVALEETHVTMRPEVTYAG